MLCALLPACVGVALGAPAAPTATVGPGVYHADRTRDVEVPRFRLDVDAVTNRDYLAFVAGHPAWRRGAVDPLFADAGYLAAWAAPLDPGAADPDAPVTGVSWFAARAYCAARGERLPTVAEWELALAHPRGIRGLHDMMAWEWTLDFDSDLAATGDDAGRFCGGGAVDAADATDYAAFMRSATRASLEASYTTSSLGFRCAADQEPHS